MIVVLERGITDEQVALVQAQLESLGLEGRVVRTVERPLIHVHRGTTRKARKLARVERVVGVVPTSGPRVRREGRRFYPYHFVNWSAVALLTMGVLVALAGFFPPGLGAVFDPRSPASASVDAWYLRAFERASALFPAESGWLVWPAAFAALALLYLLPRLDRGVHGRTLVLGVGAALVLGSLFLVMA